MDPKKKSLIIFCLLFLITFVYHRLRVLISYEDYSKPYIREITGLNFHHYHYGLVILTIALLLYLFYSKNNIVVAFLGIGLGTILDSFNSRLFPANTRMQEIINYNVNFYSTLILFGIIILAAIIFYSLDKEN